MPTKKVAITLALGAAVLLGAPAVRAASRPHPNWSPQAGAVTHQARQTNISQSGRPDFSVRHPRYQVAPGDVLQLNFLFTPSFNQTLTVQPDGFITLRGLGDFYAQGKTTAELAQALRESYAKLLNRPVITVDLTNFEKPYFVVGGQVSHPGKYPLRGFTSLTEAIEIAGGFNDKSRKSDVLLFRRVSASYVEVHRVNIKEMLRAANLDEDVALQPGDMIYVPQNAISKIARFLPASSLSMYFSPLHF